MTSLKIGFSPLDYEPNIAIKMASAGLGACIAEAVTFPLDTAKVRLMIQGEATLNGRYKGLFNTIKVVSQTEGTKALYSGLVAGLHRQIVVGSLRIGIYDNAKLFFSKVFHQDHVDLHHTSIPTRICAGISTGILAITFGQPTDVVKVRMQAQGASGVVRYDGAFSAYRKIAVEEGVTGLWKGLTPNMMRMAIVNAAEIVSYDVIKSSLVRKNLMTDNAPCHLFSAIGAGFITTIVASPVDVLKTRYMNSFPGQYSGLLHCVIVLWKEKGVAAFYKGCVPSFLRLASWNIVMFTSYEQLKRGIARSSDYVYSRNGAKLEAKDIYK